jgi:hypothetical protein
MIDAYNISFILMNMWRNYSMRASGTTSKLNEVPVYVEVGGELVKIVDVVDTNGKIILIKESK